MLGRFSRPPKKKVQVNPTSNNGPQNQATAEFKKTVAYNTII